MIVICGWEITKIIGFVSKMFVLFHFSLFCYEKLCVVEHHNTNIFVTNTRALEKNIMQSRVEHVLSNSFSVLREKGQAWHVQLWIKLCKLLTATEKTPKDRKKYHFGSSSCFLKKWEAVKTIKPWEIQDTIQTQGNM